MTFEGAKDATATVRGCPRCGEEHTGLFFENMRSPIQVSWVGDRTGLTVVNMTHWALCPRKAEPILMRMVDNGEIEVR